MGEIRKLDKFFSKMDALGLSLSYNDVRLKTRYSDIMPEQTDTSSLFSRNVPLNIPISSAAMDTVTEHKMAIAMAQLGGIGVLHRGLSIEQQVEELKKVKFYLNGLIEKPITFTPESTLAQILELKKKKNFDFNSFPIVDNNKLVGLITGADFEFADDLQMKVRDVMRQEIITSSIETSINRAYQIMKERKVKILPLTNKGKLSGLYIWKDVKRIISGEEKMYNVDKNNQLRVAAAIGVNDFERADSLIQFGIDALVIDTAHGDSKGVIETVKWLKKRYDVDVIAGNISEPEGVINLYKAGADGIKIGQGPGSICTTRIVAGIGAPQLSAVYECAKEAKKYNIPIIADGGLQQSGDIPIALAAGASSVMMGSMFAGTKESPGEIVFNEGRQWKKYRGMGSLEAMASSKSSRERYGQKEGEKNTLVPEGVEGLTPYKGPLKDIMIQYVGGLQKGMGYIGARTILELQLKADFRRLTSAGMAESHPHDIRITSEAPNYKL